MESQYDQIKTKAVADWDQNEQKLFLEYQAELTDRNREVMEAMEMEKKLGQSLLDRHKTKRSWTDWIGDPFREKTFADPDPNERIIFGDNEVSHEEPAPVPSTGDPDKDKWFQAMERVLEQMAPQEYKLVSYPVFDGTQDPYEWLIKYENSCTINRVRTGEN